MRKPSPCPENPNRYKNDKGETPLHAATLNQDIAVIDALLEAGADPQARSEGGLTPLHGARTEEVVKTLVEAGADPMAKSGIEWTPLHAATSWNRDISVIEAMLEAGADPQARSKSGSIPLHDAQTKEVVKTLVEAGADPMAKDDTGVTPLHAAMSNRDISVVEALLEAGADPQARTEGGLTPGLTPLHGACTVEVVKTLVEAGADPMAKDHGGQTPMHHAVRELRAVYNGVVTALVRAGASPMAKDHYGWTPLHIAAIQRDSTALRVLLRHGASVGARWYQLGHTPLDRAVQRANISAIEALLDAGAAPDRWTMRHARSCRDLQGTPSLVRLTDTWQEQRTVAPLVSRIAGWIGRLGQR